MSSRRDENSGAEEDVGNRIGGCWDPSEYHTAWCRIQAEVGWGYHCMSLFTSHDLCWWDRWPWRWSSHIRMSVRSDLSYKHIEVSPPLFAHGMELMIVHNCDVMIREDVSYPNMTLLIIDYRRWIHWCPTRYKKIHSSFNGNQQDRWSIYGDIRCIGEGRRR